MHLSAKETRYQLLPPLSEAQYQALKADIAENGVLVPVEYDEDGNILDGFHRVRACSELGIEDWPSITRMGLTESEKRTHARRVNTNRRHLSREQKREQIRAQLKDTPKWSNNRIAQTLGVDDKTVKTVRSAMETASEIPKLDTLEGVDGKEYPAEIPEPEPEKQKDMAGLWAADQEKRKKQAEDAKKLRDEAPDLFEEVASGEKSISQAKRELTKRKKKDPPPLPEDKYRIIYADPPWKYSNKGLDDYGHAERHYPTLSIKEICALGAEVKGLAASNAVLFLWTTSPMLEDAFKVIKAWGFKYKTSFVWDKVKHNFGHYNSVRHEFLLVCTRGSCTPDESELFDSVQMIERSDKHSEKPGEFRGIIDTLYTHGKRIELFARGEANGWDTWGNEAPS